MYRTVEIDVVSGAEDMILELDLINDIRSAAIVSSAGPAGHPVVEIIGTPDALESVLAQYGYESDVDLYATDK